MPQSYKKKGSTRSFPHYDLKKTSELVKFHDNLTSFDGGSKSSIEADQICMDISKYLAFADCKCFSWNHLLNPDKLKSYITHLQKNGVGPDGVLTKLDRIQAAVRYLMRDLVQYKKHVTEGKIILERLALWKTSFRAEKIANVRDRAAREKDTTSEDLKATHNLVHSTAAFEKVKNILEEQNPSDDHIDFLATYIFLCLWYKNLQRPGPATNMTLKEGSEGEFVSHGKEDDKLKLIVSKHKTAKTYGPAILYLSQDDATMFIHYRDYIRPNILTKHRLIVTYSW